MDNATYNFDFLDDFITKSLASSKPEEQLGDDNFFVDPDEDVVEMSNYSEEYNPDNDEALQEVRSATMNYLLEDDEDKFESMLPDLNPSGLPVEGNIDYMFPFSKPAAKVSPTVSTVTPKTGSIAETHNNPGNLKYASWMKKYGAVPGKKGLDGGQFAKFPDVNAALAARSELLQKPMYATKTVNEAMKLYSNKGYDGNIYPEIKDKKMSELTQKELTELTRRQVIREDRGYAKKLKFQTGGTPIARTEQAQSIGLNNDEFDDMILPLDGVNTIRGLDSGKPVYVRDQNGKTDVLLGPDDTTDMEGPVYEKKMYGGKYKIRK